MDVENINKRYWNRQGEIVKDLENLSSDDPMYEKGFRFKDSQDRTYRPNGYYNIRDIQSKYDLVKIA